MIKMMKTVITGQKLVFCGSKENMMSIKSLEVYSIKGHE
jgi:hypothetical protein